MSIDFHELARWFSARRAWLQDAARRLFEAGELTNADLADLLLLCKREAGIAALDQPCTGARPVSASALNILGNGVPLRLDVLSELKGINALAPRHSLHFTSPHLTIVYGSNGSGKSGYIRVLKHICGGRGLRTLHRNVFDPAPVEQGCKVTYTHGTVARTIEWKPNDGVHPDLRSISLFDTDCANVYINDENQVAYEPTLLCYFRRLVEVSEHLCTQLKNEVAAKTSTKPSLPPEHAPSIGGRWYAALSQATTDAAISQHCTWSDELDVVLNGLVRRLSEANPGEKAKALRNVKAHVHTLLTSIREMQKLVNDDSLTHLLAARADANAKRRAADDDAKKIFENSPLKGVASESWQLLWEKARLYSESLAYPGKVFPVVTLDARCVLCQQTLSDDAPGRMSNFEAFIKGSLESDAKAADIALNSIITSITNVPTDQELQEKLDLAGIADESLRGLIKDHFCHLKTRRDAILNAKMMSDATPLPASTVEHVLANIEIEHEATAAAFDEDAKKDNKKELADKVRDLRGQKWLAEQKTMIQAEIVRLKDIALLEDAQRFTNTKALSEKKTALSELLITGEFITRFEDELAVLGASRLKVTIEKTRTTKGQVWHRVALKDNTLPIMTREVLSEGELRVVSIAAFLADVAINQDNAAFVFDDPISSLDQDFEERAALRLASVSKTRQVIIFTHRISLLHLIEEAAKKVSVECVIVSLQRQPWGTGEPSELPLSAQKPAKALNTLLNDRLAKAKNAFDEYGNDEYQMHAKALCGDFRIIVERTIENDLMADVVQRFRRAINTMGKIHKLAKITADDCNLFDELMTKYSRYEHAQPDEAPVPLPEPSELEADLKRLKNWLDSFSKR